jgi:oligopeptide transport system substrate-binding protein
MRKVKWIFLAYITAISIMIVVFAVAMTLSPPRDSQTLYNIYIVNLKSLDPAVSNDVQGNEILSHVYECLYTYEYPTKPYKLVPGLAADMPEVSADGLTYTIKLKKGIRFYDPEKRAFADGLGPEMKASDVLHSWKRVANFHLASPNYSTVFQDKIVGLDDWYAYTKATDKKSIDFSRPVEGLKAIDDYTIQIKLIRPAPQLRFQLAHGSTSIVSKQADEFYRDRENNHGEAGLNKHPIGTGPYMMTQHLEDQRVIFEANPAYRGHPSVDGYANLPPEKRLPKIKRLQFDYIRENIPMWLLFQQGYYDLLETLAKESFDKAIDPTTRELRPELSERGMKLIKTPEATIFYLGFNFNDPVVGKNKPLRQAMSMAHNREKFIAKYRNGRGTPCNGPIPPGFPLYNKDHKNPYTTFNLPAARALMQQAVRINGGPIPPIKLLMGDTDSDTRQLAEYIVSEMREIGVELHVDYNTWARFQEMVDARETQMFQLGWAADYPDEQTYLMLFYGKFSPPTGVNSTGYVNPKYDELYEKASTMERSPQRDKLYQQMIDIINEDCYWIHMYARLRFDIQYDWVTDFVWMDYGGGYRQFLELDVAKRQARHR